MSKDKILEKIKSVKMHSKWYFVIKTILFVIGLTFTTISLVYLFSFIIFINIYLTSFPWLIMAIGIVLIALLETLIRRYSFAYRKPLIYSLASIFLFVVAGSALVYTTPLHEDLFIRAYSDRLPVAGELYKVYGTSENNDTSIGVVKEINNEEIKVEDKMGQNLSIIVDPDTRLKSDKKLEKDDEIVIVSKKDKKDKKLRASRLIKLERKKNLQRDKKIEDDRYEERHEEREDD